MAAFEEIRSLLLEGVHLFTPLPDRPFFMETDMSQVAYGITLLQYADDGSRRTILHFDKLFTKTQRYMPAAHKHARLRRLDADHMAARVLRLEELAAAVERAARAGARRRPGPADPLVAGC